MITGLKSIEYKEEGNGYQNQSYKRQNKKLEVNCNNLGTKGNRRTGYLQKDKNLQLSKSLDKQQWSQTKVLQLGITIHMHRFCGQTPV